MKKRTPKQKPEEPIKPTKPLSEDPNDHYFNWDNLFFTESAIERLCEDMLNFPDTHPQAKTLNEFMRWKKLYSGTFWRLHERNEKFKRAVDSAKEALGARLWANAVDNKGNWKATHFMLHTYSKEYDNANQYHSKLSQEKTNSEVAQLASLISVSNKDKIHDSNK
jgi:hypothetical protein